MNSISNTWLVDYKAARSCTFFFVLAVFVGFIYTLTSGTYNGDFYGVSSTLGIVGNTLVFIASLFPYVLGWGLYTYFKKKPVVGGTPVNPRVLSVVFFVFIAWFTWLTVEYGVGVMAADAYSAPTLLMPIIQISNRIHPFYLGVLFILVYRRSRMIFILGVAGLLVLGVLRAGLGVFLYVILAMFIRYRVDIFRLIYRNFFRLATASLIFSLAIGQLYELRDSLRGDDQKSEVVFSATEVITARLMGRISSISDTAVVFQETPYFSKKVEQLSPFYFQEQAFGGAFGIIFMPDVIPERLLLNVYGEYDTNSTFMTGLPGNLYVSWLISPMLAIVNLITVVILSVLVFYFARKIRFEWANEFALILLLYPLTSGVASEFSGLAVSIAAIWVLFWGLRVLRWRSS